MKRKILFGRVRAGLWAVATGACLLWFPDSIVYVIIASGYANVMTDLSVAEAADDRAILEELHHLRALVEGGQDAATR